MTNKGIEETKKNTYLNDGKIKISRNSNTTDLVQYKKNE
jgi:hypothetical protein